ncbi:MULTISPECIES: GAF and ANTAR domain-containing protein [unclassified Geodermatophilus]|uniref:GAF and ANTAR domain-containing protein n=1 Tax=unclassified Geodermatophilus TaxID=2637632 RepID=UPI003EEBFF34
MDSPRSAERLAVLARLLQAEQDVAAMLKLVVDAALRELPGADHVSVTVRGFDGAPSRVCTDVVAGELDQLQYDTGAGPCLAAVSEHEVVRVDDLAADPRWPDFGTQAVRRGVASVLSVPLFVESGGLGALNLYAAAPSAFPPEAVRAGGLLGTHVAVALVAARTAAGLRTALANRDTIGQAKGILMERNRITASRAFELLVDASQRSNRKLREVAEQLALTGDLTRLGVVDVGPGARQKSPGRRPA